MIPFLKRAKVDVACVGNHDLDFGVERFQELSEMCEFPWLLSNILWKNNKEPLWGTKLYHIIEHKGKKIGFFGVAEQAWVETLGHIEWETIIFED